MSNNSEEKKQIYLADFFSHQRGPCAPNGLKQARSNPYSFVQAPKPFRPLPHSFMSLSPCSSASTDFSPPQTSPKISNESSPHSFVLSPGCKDTNLSTTTSKFTGCSLSASGTQNPFVAPLSSATRRRRRRIRRIRGRSCIAFHAIRLGQGVSSKVTDRTAFVYHNRHAKCP